MNILHLTPDFNYADGRSYYVYLLLKYFNKSGHNVFLGTNKGDSFDRLNKLGIPAIIIPSLSDKRSFLRSVNQVSKMIKDHRIQIIHSHHRYHELLACSAALNNLNVHTVFSALSIVNKRYFVEYKSEKIIAVSKTVRNMLVEKFSVNEDKIFLIPNFADSEEEITDKHDISNAGNENSQIRILSIGRFHREKNFETLLKAAVLIKNYKIKIYLIGSGEEEANYREIVKRNNLDVEFISPVSDLTEFFKIADMCILTSVRDPLPGFMLQSGLHEKPFIGSAVDGISETIKDGENGLLFEKENETELAEKIKLFKTDKFLAEKCAKNLRKLVMNNYTEKSVVPQIENLYAGFFR